MIIFKFATANIANLPNHTKYTMKHLFLFLMCKLFLILTIWGNPTEALPTVMFKHLSTTEGLSNNSVRSIFRDSRGFLWIGTESGLNKYDGYSFQQYHRNNSELPDDAIFNIFEGPEGNVWFRTSGGYSIYDYKTGKFDNDYKATLEELKIPGKNILGIGKTTKNEFWVYDYVKLYIWNMDNNSIKAYPLAIEKISNISIGVQCIYIMYSNGLLYSINKQTSETKEIAIPAIYKPLLKNHEPHVYTDQNESIWIYTYQNSLLLHKSNLTHQWENICLNSRNDIQYNRVQRILDLGDGNVWILTSHKGLFIYNTLNKSLTNLQHNPLKSHTIASNNLNTIYRDKDGIVYIGNFKHGISYYSPMSQTILCNKSLEYDDILTFCKDNDTEFIYYGTDGTGLIRQSLITDAYEKIPTPANIVVDLSIDSKNRLWIGTFQKGLLCYSKGQIRQYATDNSQLLEDNVYTVEADKHGYIWIGTMRGYIQRLNPETETFDTILYRPGEFFVRDMYYDNDRHLYVASKGGLIIIDTETQAYNICSETARFEENNMLTVYKDSRGLLWIGHPHGLSVWNQKNDSVYFIDQKNGLTANLVRAITEDNNHQMWIGTGNGISRIQLKNGGYSIVNYSVNDGLICNDTNVHAILKLENGNILIGTPKGYQTIIPQEILSTNYDARIYLTGIELKSGTVHPDILGGSSLECAQRLSLTEKENSFTLSFSALDLIETDKIKYAYKIAQSHANWIYAENNKINLSMLPAGNYTLSVKACNSQGVWSPHIKELKIKILPPWWRTWWAYTIYTGIVLCIILLIIRNLRLRHKQAQIMQAIEVENEKQQKINNMKLQFFANISHELRTPLSLIINPLEEFFVDHPEYRKGILDIVKQNADYLLELINQLLDFRKLDAKAETLKCKHDNILIILSEIFHSFDPIAQKRNINYSLTVPQHSVFMDFDYDKIRKICTNILSNAFKFTPNKGSISLDIAVKGTNLELTFTDTGCGIEDESKEKIFQRFYQSGKKQSSNGGNGIGLHIVSEYVKMHRGAVCVKDNQPCGSVFLITLPLHQNSNETGNGELVEVPETREEAHPFTILLVDDNYDFLKFLSESLAKKYRVLKATNGKQALNVLEKEDIDLVVSDIMMPEMDGLELCSTIKNDIRYSHIPIILLTAKASEEHQLEGLGVGADDYITKPFNMEVLKLRINKIIEMNVKRQEIFNQEIKIEPSRITITPLDQQLVEKAIRIVEDNISETEFSVEELASSLNISRSYFYKKMIKITGKKPIEFIRTIRMKRAQQLLTESQMQIAEIAYTLGYNSPKVFSKHFKDEFHISPSEFIRQQAEKTHSIT